MRKFIEFSNVSLCFYWAKEIFTVRCGNEFSIASIKKLNNFAFSCLARRKRSKTSQSSLKRVNIHSARFILISFQYDKLSAILRHVDE